LPLQVQEIQKDQSRTITVSYPAPDALTIDPRNDLPPFNDIRVRKACRWRLTCQLFAKPITLVPARPYPSSTTSYYMKGWGWPYEEWPQDLKDEYAYNPTMPSNCWLMPVILTALRPTSLLKSTGDIDLLKIVQSYFAAVGIDMEIRTMDAAAETALSMPISMIS